MKKLKHLKLKKSICSRNNCKASVYAEGLCYKHLAEKINKEMESKPQEIEFSFNIKGIFSEALYYARIILSALIWIVTVISTVMLIIYCGNCGTVRFSLIAAASLLIPVVSYLLLKGIIKLTDKYKLAEAVYIILIVILIFWIVINKESVINKYYGFIRNIAEIVTS